MRAAGWIEGRADGGAAVQLEEAPAGHVLNLRVGEIVEVRSEVEILATLDERAEQRIGEVWQKLSEGGKVLMPLQAYPFSKRYGWVEDRFGVSWQLILTDPKGEPRPGIIPFLLFTGPVVGHAEEASDFYLSVFEGSCHASTHMLWQT